MLPAVVQPPGRAAGVAPASLCTSTWPHWLPLPVEHPQESDKFDTVCLATAAHKLAGLKGAPNMHATITSAPEFYKLKQLICECRCWARWGCWAALGLEGSSSRAARGSRVAERAAPAGCIGSCGGLRGVCCTTEHKQEAAGRACGSAAPCERGVSAEGPLAGPDKSRHVAPRPAVERRAEFTARNIANTLWSLAKMNHHPGDKFLSLMAEQVGLWVECESECAWVGSWLDAGVLVGGGWV